MREGLLREFEMADAMGCIPADAGRTLNDAFHLSTGEGASPHMREGLRRDDTMGSPVRCIPAHAGRNRSDHSPKCHQRVHPRICVKDTRSQLEALDDRGASPHMREGPRRALLHEEDRGCIPAHAGRTTLDLRRCHTPRVYPRACGRDDGTVVLGLRDRGVSPRMWEGPPLRLLLDPA